MARESTITAFPPSAKAITPNDSTDLTDHNGQPVGMTVFCGTGGDIVVIPIGNANAVTFVVGDGAILPVEVKRVLSTGTTATDLVGLFY